MKVTTIYANGDEDTSFTYGPDFATWMFNETTRNRLGIISVLVEDGPKESDATYYVNLNNWDGVENRSWAYADRESLDALGW